MLQGGALDVALVELRLLAPRGSSAAELGLAESFAPLELALLGCALALVCQALSLIGARTRARLPGALAHRPRTRARLPGALAHRPCARARRQGALAPRCWSPTKPRRRPLRSRSRSRQTKCRTVRGEVSLCSWPKAARHPSGVDDRGDGRAPVIVRPAHNRVASARSFREAAQVSSASATHLGCTPEYRSPVERLARGRIEHRPSLPTRRDAE